MSARVARPSGLPLALRAALLGGCVAALAGGSAWATAKPASDQPASGQPARAATTAKPKDLTPRSSVESVPQAGGAYTLSVVSYRDMPFRTVIRQQYDFSCGSAALATLLRYQYGQDVDEASIFKVMYALGDKAAIQKHGFSLADMKNYLHSKGMRSDGYKLPLEKFALGHTPAIAVIRVKQYKHFVVIKSIRNGIVLVGDPALGLKSYTLADFQAVWDGVVFIIHDKVADPTHHGFDDSHEWTLLTHSPLDRALHGSELPGLTLDEIWTVFQVLPPSLANTY